MKKFIKSLAGFSLGPILGAIISFITTPLLTQNIVPVEYGKAAIFLTLYAWIQSFIYFGMDQAYTREFNEYSDEKKLLKNSMILPLSISLILLSAIFINPKFFSNIIFSSPDEVTATIVFGVSIVFIVFERFLLLYIRMREKAFEYSIFNIVIRINVFLIALFLILRGKVDFRTVVYSTALGQIFADIYLIFRYRYVLDLFGFKNIDFKLLKKLAYFGFPIMISAVVFSSLNSLDRFFLRIFATESEQGVYQATLKIAGLIAVVKTAFTSFWVPTAYRWHSQNKPMKNFQFISNLMMFIMTIAFFGIVISKDLIVYLLGSKYSESIYLIGLMVLPQLLYTASETTTLGIVFSRKSYLNIIVSLVSLIPSIILNLILTPNFGGVGAALSSGIGFLFFFTMRTYLSTKTGFKFDMKFQYLAIIIMFICATLNGFYNLPIWMNALFGCITISVQLNIFKEIQLIKKNPNYIDFS